MCPVYQCQRCRDTGLVKVYANPARNVPQEGMAICPAAKCRMARIMRLKQKREKTEEKDV